MSGYLLDTNVISMLSPGKPGLSKAFGDWLDVQDREDRLFISAVTVHEIEKGIHLLIGKGATAKAEAYKLWLTSLQNGFSDRVLSVDAAVALKGGELEARSVVAGHNPGMADALIAGTAKAHSLSVLTKNIKHFAAFPDIAVLSPDDIG